MWRRLRSLGVVPLKRSAYLLPDTPERHEDFPWLAQEISGPGRRCNADCVRTVSLPARGTKDLSLAHRWYAENVGISMESLRLFPSLLQRSQAVVLGVCLAFALLLNAGTGRAQQANHPDRVEGVVESVQGPDAVRVQTANGLVTVDLAALGGVTVSVTPGQRIVAQGTMESSGDLLHATQLQSPSSH